MVGKMKFIAINKINYLFVIIVIKGIPYDFVIRILLDFGLIISFTIRITILIIISSTIKISSTLAAFSTFKTFTTFRQIYNVLL